MADPGATFLLGAPNTSPALTPAGLSLSIVSRLPGLYDVDLAELLQIRDSLDPYLVRFRSAMVTIADDIASRAPADATTLAQEIDRLWYRDVQPAIREIGDQVRRGGYPRALLAAFTDDAASKVGAGASVALASGSLLAGASALIPAAVAASVPFVRAFATRLDAREKSEENRLFFVYAAQKELRKRGAVKRPAAKRGHA